MGCIFMCCAPVRVGLKVNSLTNRQKILCVIQAWLQQAPRDHEWGKMLEEVDSTYSQQEYLQLYEPMQKVFWTEALV